MAETAVIRNAQIAAGMVASRLESNAVEYRNSDMEKLIDEYVHKDRDRAILKDRFINGMCYEPLAEKYDLSVKHVKNIVYKYDEMLFTKLEKL